MTDAYWYLVATFLLPYCFSILIRSTHPDYNHRSPREFFETLEGWRKRTYWVQLNSFEIFPPFAAAVIIAHQLEASQHAIDLLALLFLSLRVLYGFFYIFDRPILRSLSFVSALGCIIGLFIISM
ncbi:MAG TPA: MAPEG family protein [Gammaproteobacteria bacterium]|nr:MAPEG family protein [Gammaproteobacteria bacterium]